MRTFEIAGRVIGPNSPCFLIAEAGVNHNGSLELAMKLVEAAARAGADAVKFQTFCPEEIASAAAPKAEYQKKNMPIQESQIDMLRRLALGPNEFAQLAEHCDKLGILFLSTPFDIASAKMLNDLGMEGFKIGSGELINLPLLKSIARFGKPIILSSGMARMGEIEQAVVSIRNEGLEDIALLHCITDYPARAEDSNLKAMHTMAAVFGLPIGFSDHSEGIDISCAAVALGACLVEKHFTLDKSLPGPDHAASVDPVELASWVRSLRRVQSALGHGRKEPLAQELVTAAIVRRSLIASIDMKEGTIIAPDHLIYQRPSTGLPLQALDYVVGRRAKQAISKGTPLAWDLLE